MIGKSFPLENVLKILPIEAVSIFFLFLNIGYILVLLSPKELCFLEEGSFLVAEKVVEKSPKIENIGSFFMKKSFLQ